MYRAQPSQGAAPAWHGVGGYDRVCMIFPLCVDDFDDVYLYVSSSDSGIAVGGR